MPLFFVLFGLSVLVVASKFDLPGSLPQRVLGWHRVLVCALIALAHPRFNALSGRRINPDLSARSGA